MSVFIIPSIALHLDTTALSDGTYELISESDGGDIPITLSLEIGF